MNRRPKCLAAVACVGALLSAGAAHAAPFTFIQAGYTAEVVALNPGFLGGVAFAADGDILSNSCAFSGSPLIRWDVQGPTALMGGSTVFSSRTDQPSNAGCGMTTHSNGSIYTNTGGGVVRLSDTGTQIGAAGGSPGNALGITEDPITGNLYYVDSSSGIRVVTAALAPVGGVFASNGGFTDGIFWNPDGSLLYTTDRSSFTLDVFDRTGVLVDSTPIGHEPDGIAFSKAGFVLTNNTDGTISRIDPDGTVSLFASGGFRGDLAHVGPDGCWYVTQDGTRFADGSTNPTDSIVKICATAGGGFEPPPGTEPPPNGTPEPGSLAIVSLALGVAGWRRRRRA